ILKPEREHRVRCRTAPFHSQDNEEIKTKADDTLSIDGDRVRRRRDNDWPFLPFLSNIPLGRLWLSNRAIGAKKRWKKWSLRGRDSFQYFQTWASETGAGAA